MQTNQNEWANSSENNIAIPQTGTGAFPSHQNSREQTNREYLKLQARELKNHTQGLVREARRNSGQRSASVKRLLTTTNLLSGQGSSRMPGTDLMPFSGRSHASRSRNTRTGSASVSQKSPCPLRTRGDSMTQMYKFKNEGGSFRNDGRSVSPATKAPIPPMHKKSFKVPKGTISAQESANDIANSRTQ